MEENTLHEPDFFDLSWIQKNIVGFNREVPLLNGEKRRYINFDNAASTPALKPVLDTVNQFMEWYSSIHRGTGFKSLLCSETFNHSRKVIADFVNIDLESHIIIFVKNTTEAINKLANRYPVADDEIVILSKIEHHSNDLPWRTRAKVLYTDIHPDGRLNENDLVKKLKDYLGKVALVSLTGASNVSGWVNDINRLAEICHHYGTKIMIDAAQLAPHRPIDMQEQDSPGHIDFLAFSAHKIYAPFGSGVLIGDKDVFEEGEPDYVGGGTVSIVGKDYVYWNEAPEKEEAGTPNTVGVVAFAKSLQILQKIGMNKIADHEKELTHYILSKMREIPGIKIYGSRDPEVVDNRLGVITFNLSNKPHALTTAILNFEGGIGVRNGCFCAHPYLKELMCIPEEEAHHIEKEILAGDRSNLPGAVRASFGIYNCKDEIDALIDLLKKINKNDYKGEYLLDKKRGEYHPKNFKPPFEKYFKL